MIVPGEPSVPSSFPGLIAQALRRESGNSVPETRLHATRRAAAFARLATHVESLKGNDPLIRALAQVQTALTGKRDHWGPSPRQRKFCSLLGLSGDPPGDAGELLEELVALGVADLPPRLAEAEQRAKDAEHKAGRLEAKAAKVPELKAKLTETEGALDGERNATRAAAGDRDRFKGLWEAAASGEQPPAVDENGGTAPKPKPEAKKPPRRKAVEGHTGIYLRESAKGTTYEIGYQDTAGKQRWKTVGPDLDAAIKEREERVAEVERLKSSERRPSAVAPLSER